MQNMANLNCQQQHCLEIILKGHNLLIHGQAGTGKTFLVKTIKTAMEDIGKKCSITCTTGKACSQYSSHLKPMTIHRWSGIDDGRFEDKELVSKLSNDESRESARKRIIYTDVVIIDEVSMLSAKMLDQLNVLLRSIRHSKQAFGGVQIVLVGDFLQLPPVSSVRYGDKGEYAFQAKCFPAFAHIGKLHQVVRQTEEPFIHAINELARGTPTEPTFNFIHQLQRPILNKSAICLFATNLQVDLHNVECLLEQRGQAVTYDSCDTGDQHLLQTTNGVSALKHLTLKPNVPVMLLRNLTDQLVNGTIGTVVDLDESGPLVDFGCLNKMYRIKPICFSVFDKDQGRNLAERTQIPLKLAYGITIHKSQGMTMEYVKIDCSNITKPGQLAVGMGRCTSSKGVQLINFQRWHVMRQPKCVLDFVGIESEGLKNDYSCCKDVNVDENVQEYGEEHMIVIEDEIENEEPNCVDQEISDEQLYDAVSQIVYEEDAPCMSQIKIDTNTLVTSTCYPNPITQFQHNVNNIINTVSKAPNQPLNKFCTFQLNTLHQSYHGQEPIPTPVTQRHINTFLTQNLNKQLTSAQFGKKCQSTLFQTQVPLTKEQYHVVFRVTNYLRECFITDVMKGTVSSKPPSMLRNTPLDLQPSQLGKIRYVGGYCVAKSIFKLNVKLKSAIYGKNSDTTELNQIKHSLKLLRNITRSQAHVLSDSTLKESLLETERKQNVRLSLTHISDDACIFFQHMCKETFFLLTDANLQSHKENLHQFVIKSLSNSEDIVEQWCKLCDETTTLCSKLLEDIVRLYVTPLVNQFRKDFKEKLAVEKKKALRKRIRSPAVCSAPKVPKMTPIKLTFDFILSDNSPNKTQTHTSLKEHILNKKCIPPNLTKPHLKALCTAYNVIALTKDTKAQLQNKLKAAVAELDTIPKCQVLEDAHNSKTKPSGGQVLESKLDNSLECRRSTTTRQHDLENKCRVCQKEYMESEEWIQCDNCNRWFHRVCAEIDCEEEWLRVSSDGSQFVCFYCSE